MQRTLAASLVALSLACTTTTVVPSPDGSIDAGGRDTSTTGDVGGDASCDRDGDGHTAVDCGGDDCDDTDAMRHPGGTEVCDASHHDEDCDPATFGTRDVDGDGDVDAACCNGSGATTQCGSDCDDAHGSVHYGAVEVCNAIDDDCDGAVDEQVLIDFHPDTDGDGFGDGTAAVTRACAPPAGYVFDATDCNDHARLVHPGASTDCDCSASHPYDADDDGYVSLDCGGDDCDDGNGAIHPSAMETCNAVDDNCDGQVNESPPLACTPGRGGGACTSSCGGPSRLPCDAATCTPGTVCNQPTLTWNGTDPALTYVAGGTTGTAATTWCVPAAPGVDLITDGPNTTYLDVGHYLVHFNLQSDMFVPRSTILLEYTFQGVALTNEPIMNTVLGGTGIGGSMEFDVTTPCEPIDIGVRLAASETQSGVICVQSFTVQPW